MQILLRHCIQMAWLTSTGHRCHGRLARVDGNATALRVQQYQVLMHPRLQKLFARDLVARKVRSQVVARVTISAKAMRTLPRCCASSRGSTTVVVQSRT